MRKNLLALSIAAMVGGLSGVANAAVFNNNAAAGVGASQLAALGAGTFATVLEPTVSGVGHILVVPYFTSQGTNATLLNLVNTDQANGKAVKLRFRGAANSDDIFDISIFLSPGDMWTANVSASGELSALTTSDKSCTLPSAAAIVAAGGLFKTGRVQGAAAAQTREGYIEILNMADIPPLNVAGTAANALFTATKHVNGVAPCTASVMDLQATDLSDTVAANSPGARGYSWPTGGLMANWTIVNLADKASFSGEAVAVRANLTAGGASGPGNIVFFPQTADAPTFPTGNAVYAAVANVTADPLLQSAGFAGQVANYDFPDLSTPYVAAASAAPATQAGQLATALTTTHVTNEFLTGTVADFATDWVFSMPTRRYAVALDYANPVLTAGNRILFNGAVAAHFTAANTSLNADGSKACVVPGGTLRAFDAEENTNSTFVISPDVALRFCGETSVLSFNTASSQVLGAKIANSNIPAGYSTGWLRINTTGLGAGLPLVGFAAAKAKGVNLGGTWNHRNSK